MGLGHRPGNHLAGPAHARAHGLQHAALVRAVQEGGQLVQQKHLRARETYPNPIVAVHLHGVQQQHLARAGAQCRSCCKQKQKTVSPTHEKAAGSRFIILVQALSRARAERMRG